MNGLKRIRKEQRYTLRAVAEHLGVSLQTVFNYEKGKREPTLDTLKKLAAFFNCTVDELL